MTKREAFTKILEIVKDNEELAKVIEHEIELLDKKNVRDSEKRDEKKAENLRLAEIVYDCVPNDMAVTLGVIAEKNEELATLSTSKISYLLKTLIDSGRVERVYEKRVSLYKRVGA
jgi:hypothetical protein